MSTAATAEAVADVAEGGAFFLHRPVAAVGDPRRRDQAEEDPKRRADVDSENAGVEAGMMIR